MNWIIAKVDQFGMPTQKTMNFLMLCESLKSPYRDFV